MLGGSVVPGMEQPHTGQLLIHNTCAAGRCHSQTATGSNRVGVPAGLNFDVVPASTAPEALAIAQSGHANVEEWAEDMWGEINEGSMPPEGQRNAPTAVEKEAMRNWLACGAPLINAPVAAIGGTDWPSLHDALAAKGCQTCHSQALAMNNPFLDGTACDSYARLFQPSAGLECRGMVSALVVPGQPDASLLIQKTGPTPPCGVSMPQASPQPLGVTDPALVQNLRAFIMAGAPKPPTCP